MMSSQEVVARRRKKCVNDHPASAKELKIEEGKGERRNRETEKKGGERERERGRKKDGRLRRDSRSGDCKLPM